MNEPDVPRRAPHLRERPGAVQTRKEAALLCVRIQHVVIQRLQGRVSNVALETFHLSDVAVRVQTQSLGGRRRSLVTAALA